MRCAPLAIAVARASACSSSDFIVFSSISMCAVDHPLRQRTDVVSRPRSGATKRSHRCEPVVSAHATSHGSHRTALLCVVK
jgi:hypothetical protein